MYLFVKISGLSIETLKFSQLDLRVSDPNSFIIRPFVDIFCKNL